MEQWASLDHLERRFLHDNILLFFFKGQCILQLCRDHLEREEPLVILALLEILYASM